MSDRTSARVYPVILSGGSGTRLWPKSRTLFPKQFHSLTSEHTLLQEALLRVRDTDLYAKPIIVCNEDHRFIAAEQAAKLGIELQDILLEPEGRNTAPAVAAAAALVRKIDPDGMVLVLASDHHIGDPEAFSAAVRLGVPAAVAGYICTFGIVPTCPETGYGYIKRNTSEVSPGVFGIAEFKEKPDLETAKAYVADGNYAWNAGLFLCVADTMLKELDKFEPSITPACEEAIEFGLRDHDVNFLRLSKPHFAKAKAMSLDYAVMEKTQHSAVISLDAQWTDVGSWPSLYQTCLHKDHNSAENKTNGVYTHGMVVQEDVKNCYLSTDGPLLAAIGCDNLCVIATEDAVMVLPMDRAQDVGKLAKSLKKDAATCDLARMHRSQYKPWGFSKTIAAGAGFKVLQLTIKPGAATSLQMHFHRAMHHIVVSGVALMTHGADHLLLTANQSSFVGIGIGHRLHNPGKVPLVVIEVQSGNYLEEADTVRVADPFFSTKPEELQKLMSNLKHIPADAGAAVAVQLEEVSRIVAPAPAPVPVPVPVPAVPIPAPAPTAPTAPTPVAPAPTAREPASADSLSPYVFLVAGVVLGACGMLAAGFKKGV